MPAAVDRKIVRMRDLPAETGLSLSQCKLMIAAGVFPRPARLTPRCVGWFMDEIHDWREQKRRERDAGN